MPKFIVEGGEFKSTAWEEVIPGTEESYGPFETYPEARTAWQNAMFSPKLDICTHRVFIKEV